MHRYLVYVLAILLLPVSLYLAGYWAAWYWGVGISAAMVIVGTWDLLQKRSTLRRNYPVMAHFRYGLESIGPEIRQYFVQSDLEDVPFSRQQRALIYQRSKNEMDVVPFGTLRSTYAVDYEWINHSLAPTEVADHDFRVLIGPNCAKPYSASVFNISAMSFGSLSANAIRALNEGARRGGFYHDTGEGSISPYHREMGGDLVWEIGSGYFGCRDEHGGFSEERFVANANTDQVKMIEIKLSQGAKPGHGGVLPAAKVSAEISATRGVPMGVDCVSPSKHSAFNTPVELLQFVVRLRELSGGKPVGFKLAIGHPWEWFGIAKAMQETGLLPDFIVVDGAEGGTGAAPAEFIDHVGVPMHEALLLVHNTLVGLDLRDRIRVGAAGKVSSAFEIARTIALGADWCNAGRGFMFALGCIQSLSCHTDRCPTGVTSQDPLRNRALVVPHKIDRVYNYHRATLHALAELLAAAGLEHPQQLRPFHFSQRTSTTEVCTFAQLYPQLRPGELLDGTQDRRFRDFWAMARADSFQAET
jgi:glutamate synthase domain-containing protein 2